MSAPSMTTHVIDNNTYAIFNKEEKGGVWMLQFLWGKKDFRIYLGRHSDRRIEDYQGPMLESEDQGEVIVIKYQYLNAFEWFDYKKVSGHGLAIEEVCWQMGKTLRYVELPRGFYEVGVELVCREFGLKRQPRQLAG